MFPGGDGLPVRSGGEEDRVRQSGRESLGRSRRPGGGTAVRWTLRRCAATSAAMRAAGP